MLHEGEPDEGGSRATCLEVPGASGQGETREKCRQNPAGRVRLIIGMNEEEVLLEAAHAVKTILAPA